MELLNKVVSTVKKKSPEFLVFTGIAGVVVGTVLVAKEARKMDPIIEEHKAVIKDIHDTKENREEQEYSEKDKRKDLAIAYAKTGTKFAKLFLPGGLVLVGSVACILQSHKILNKRNLGLTAAYTGLSTVFEEYRKNIVDKFGEEADLEARYSIKASKLKGKKGEEGETVYQETDKTGTNPDDHSRFFDASSIYWDKSPNINLMTIHSAEVNLNRKLKTNRDHKVSLSECLNALDLLPAKDGRVLGYEWRPGIDPVDENGVPQVIKIPIYSLNNKGKKILKSVDEIISEGRDEPVMLLDFPNLITII